MKTNQEDTTRLPIRHKLTLAYALSLAIAALLAVASVAGLLYQTAVYPTDELVQSFLPNDVVNLVIGIPILLASMWLAGRGKLVGLLLWPGALFYVLYTYIVYVLTMPFNAAFLLHLTLVALSAYALVVLAAGIDGNATQRRLTGVVPERLGGGVLTGIGILNFGRVTGMMVTALINRTPVALSELALLTADFLIAPALVISGVLLWRRQALGYVTGLGLLFQASMLFIGLLFVMILGPFVTAVRFSLSDALVVLVMGMICFIPLALFVRGAWTQGDSSPPQLGL